MKKINLLKMIFILGLCFSNITSNANANTKDFNSQSQKSIIKNTTPSTPLEEKDTSYLTKRTSLTNDEIYNLYKQGLNRDDIKACYIFKLLSNEEFKDIIDIFLNEKKDVNLTIKDLRIDTQKYEDKYNFVFPANDTSDHDFVNRNKPLYRQSPPFKN